jgi:uncharacterized protein YqgQ
MTDGLIIFLIALGFFIYLVDKLSRLNLMGKEISALEDEIFSLESRVSELEETDDESDI